MMYVSLLQVHMRFRDESMAADLELPDIQLEGMPAVLRQNQKRNQVIIIFNSYFCSLAFSENITITF